MDAPPAKPKRPFWKRLAQNLALSAVTFLLCVVVFEAALRLAGYGNLEIYEPDPSLYWKLKPNQNCYTKIGRKPVRINSHGTRGAEFPAAKPPGTFRIISLGDSRTFGWGVAESNTYSALIEGELQQSLGATCRVEVINTGVNAWSYPQFLVFFRDTALKWQPDMVIIGEANLWTQFSESNSPEFVRKFMSRVRLKNFLRRFALYHYVVEVKLKDFYEKHRTRFIPVDPKQDPLFKEQQQADPDAAFQTAINSLCLVAITNGVKPVLLFLPAQDQLQTSNVPPVLRIKSLLAQQRSVPLVDVTEAARPRVNELYLEGDPVHFNEAGHALIARELAGAIRKQAGL